MTYLIMVRVEKGRGNCKPPRWKKVCCCLRLYPSADWLIYKKGLSADDVLNVQFTKRSYTKYRWQGYRSAFRSVYQGSVAGFSLFCRSRASKSWAKIARKIPGVVHQWDAEGDDGKGGSLYHCTLHKAWEDRHGALVVSDEKAAQLREGERP